MNLLSFLPRRGSAPVARERLQLLLSHERPLVSGQPDLVAVLREEIVAVIAKHVRVEREDVVIKMERGKGSSTLEVNVDIPSLAAA
jgi:cell division topological specificity factor